MQTRTEDGVEYYTVTNSDGTTMEFTGEVVAAVSAGLPEKLRHTEFELYLSSFGTWILQGIGRTRVKGERDYFWYVVSSDPIEFLDKILGTDASRLAKRLLRDSFVYLRDLDCGDEEEDE